MRRLTDTVKRRIVEHLACYHSPPEVAQLIKEEFGVEISPRHVRAYEPTSFQCTASQRWLDLHRSYRERFRREISAIPITHRAFRMRMLQQDYDAARESGNIALALKLLEQAAKEMGNWFVR